MSNIVSFDEFEDERQIAAHQLGLPRIVLEGRSDQQLFKEFWFVDHLADFDFLAAEDIGSGGGCQSVPDAVRLSRSRDGIPAFGILDRDHLFRSKNWSLLFAINDQHFANETDNEEFYTTLRWEVEAYLLEPDLIPQLARGHCRKGLRPESAVITAIEIAVEECEHLLKAQRLFAVGHQYQKAYSDRHFLNLDTEEFLDACENELANFQGSEELAARIGELVTEILQRAPGDPGPRLEFLLRFVNTKRLIHRLVRRLELYDDVRGFLATAMYSAKRRPDELDVQLQRIAQRLAS